MLQTSVNSININKQNKAGAKKYIKDLIKHGMSNNKMVCLTIKTRNRKS